MVAFAAVLHARAMRPTFHYRVAQRVHVAVHGQDSPRDDEWSAYLADIAAHLSRIDALWVVTHGGNLSTEQRRQSVDFWRASPKQPRIAIVTPSRLVVRVSGALRWFMPSQIKAFLPQQAEDAYTYLGLDGGRRRAVAAAVEELSAQLPSGVGRPAG